MKSVPYVYIATISFLLACLLPLLGFLFFYVSICFVVVCPYRAYCTKLTTTQKIKNTYVFTRMMSTA